MKKITIQNYGEIEFKIPNARDYIRIQRLIAEHKEPADKENPTLLESLALTEVLLNVLESVEMKKDGEPLDSADIPPAYISAVYSAVMEATIAGK